MFLNLGFGLSGTDITIQTAIMYLAGCYIDVLDVPVCEWQGRIEPPKLPPHHMTSVARKNTELVL